MARLSQNPSLGEHQINEEFFIKMEKADAKLSPHNFAKWAKNLKTPRKFKSAHKPS